MIAGQSLHGRSTTVMMVPIRTQVLRMVWARTSRHGGLTCPRGFPERSRGLVEETIQPLQDLQELVQRGLVLGGDEDPPLVDEYDCGFGRVDDVGYFGFQAVEA